MKFEAKTLGMSLLIDVPDTVDELDNMLGRKGATLENAIRYLTYHNWNPKFRPAFSDALAEASGIAREQELDSSGEPKFKPAKEGETQGEPVMESEQTHVNRVLADGFPQEEAEAIAREVAETIDFSVTKGGRSRKPLAKHITYAKKYLAACADGSKSPEDFMTKWESFNKVPFSTVGDGEWTEENLALAIRINEERKIAEAESDFAI